jgi:hypothetical protein
VHARRAGILEEAHRPLIFHAGNPQSVPTFLMDGTVAGTWQHRDGGIQVTPFEPLSRAAAAAVQTEAAALEVLFE